jgi:hypothetical protein
LPYLLYRRSIFMFLLYAAPRVKLMAICFGNFAMAADMLMNALTVDAASCPWRAALS